MNHLYEEAEDINFVPFCLTLTLFTFLLVYIFLPLVMDP